MSTNHTPGPWARNIKPATKYNTIFAGRNTHVARLEVYGLDPAEVEANCDLIAAAPDLLAALEAADKWVAMYHDLPGHDAASKCMSAVIRAAIAKATGGAA